MCLVLMMVGHMLIKEGLRPEDLVTKAAFPLDALMFVPSCILHAIPALHMPLSNA